MGTPKGIPITEFCDSNKLPARDRLELFVSVCRAIQHAHQKGVIHRDLKPTNVMVTLHDNKPMPVIIDFGVSKAISHQLTEKTLFTAYGQMVGTPAYMSPEQAQMSHMDIDTRSDIYSLGVLLFELLTGSTPLDAEQLRGTAYAEMQRLIREEEPPKPSTRLSTLGNALATIAQQRGTDPRHLGQFLRGDLDWIVLKALEKERNRRYETANALANDIQRFLKHEAVEACPPSLTYQLRKLVGRNRGLAMTAATVAAAVLLGIVGTTIGMVQARRDAARALLAMERLDEKSVQLTETNSELTAANDQLKGEQQRSRQLISQLRRQSAMMAVEKGNRLIGADDVFTGMLWLTRGLELAEEEPSLAGFAGNIRRALAASQATVPQLVRVITPEHSIERAVHSQDGSFSALVGVPWPGSEAPYQYHVSVCDNRTGQVLHTTSMERGPSSLDFRPDGKSLLICGNGADDKSPFLMTLDVDRGETRRYELPATLVPVRAVYGSDDATIHLLAGDLEENRILFTRLAIADGQIRRVEDDRIGALAGRAREIAGSSYQASGKIIAASFAFGFSEDRNTLVTDTARGVICRDLTSNGQDTRRLAITDVATNRVYSITVSPDTQRVLVDYGTKLALYRLADGQFLWEIPFEPRQLAGGISMLTGTLARRAYGYQPRPIVFTPDSRILLVYEPQSREPQSRLEVRSAETGQLLEEYEDVCRSGRAGIAWLDQEDAIVLGTRQDALVFRLPTRLALASDGRFRLGKINQNVGDIVVNFAPRARSLREIQSGRVRMQLSNDFVRDGGGGLMLVTTQGDTVIQRFMRRDSARLTNRTVAGPVTKVEVYDSRARKKRCEYQPENAFDTRLSPDGRWIAHSSSRNAAGGSPFAPRRFVDIYDSRNGELVHSIAAVEARGRLIHFAFSADSRQLAVAWSRGTGRINTNAVVHVDVWNIDHESGGATRRPVWQRSRPLSGLASSVRGMHFNRQGNMLLFMSADEVWVLPVDQPDRAARICDAARQAALLPDGEAAVVLETGGRVQLVDVETRQAFPLRFGSGSAAVRRMLLGSDASVLATTTDSHASPVRSWRMPVPVKQSPAELRSLFALSSNLRLTEHGNLELLGADDAAQPRILPALQVQDAAGDRFVDRTESFAVELLDQQQWLAALPQLEGLIERDTEDVWARAWRCRCLIELDRYEDARSELEQLSSITPRDPEYATAIVVSSNRRIEALDDGEDAERIALLLQLVVVTGSELPRAMALQKIATSHANQGELDLAVKEFAKVVELAPDYEPGFYGLAYGLKDLGRHAEAARAYQRAAELVPNNRNYLGWFESLRESGEPEAALGVMDQVVERFPAYPRTQRFDLLSRLKRWEQAAADVEHIPATRTRLTTPWWVCGPVAEPWADGSSLAVRLQGWLAGGDGEAAVTWRPQQQATEAPLKLDMPDAKPEERFVYAVTRVLAREDQRVALRVSGPVSRIWTFNAAAELEAIELERTDVREQQASLSLGGGWNTLLAELELESAGAPGEMRVVLARDRSESVQAVVVPGATWRYLHPTDGVDPADDDADFHETFFLPDFDDTGWKAGADQPGVMGGFGYGDPVGVEIGQPPKGKRFSAYFRHEFESPFALEELQLRFQRDDGVIVYLNGEEVARDNVAVDGVESYRLVADSYGAIGPEETRLRAIPLSGRVVKGRNVLAVSVHNGSPISSDVRFGEVTLEGRREQKEP